MEFMRSDRGATAIEYAIIAMLIAMGLVGVLVTMGNTVKNLYQSVAASFP